MMTKLCIFLAGIAAFVSFAQAPLTLSGFSNLVNAEQKARYTNLETAVPALTGDYNLIYHRCEWSVDPALHYISGKVTSYFIPVVEEFQTIHFDFSKMLYADSVIYHNATLSYTHENNLISIALPNSIQADQLDSITIFYQGAPQQSGFGSFVTSMHDSVPVLWTLSEPYGSSDWWPCKNGLSDKVDSLDVIITTPVQYRAASNGILMHESQEGNSKVYHWRHRYPIASYLVCMAVTNYIQYVHHVPYENTITEVLNYIYPEDSARAVAQTKYIMPMMQLFDSLFGVYPFVKEKYGHCQFGWGGGMEHQTFTFLSDFNFELLAHELAHQWFGDKITCGTWEDIWLNEGFATYLSGLCYERLLPEWWRQFKIVRLQHITSDPSGSVFCSDTTSVGRIFNGRLSYSKGSMILHQLRWVLGDSVFFKALYNYINDPELTYRFARTGNLIYHLENTAGQNLNWYFDDWYTGEGYPSYQIQWSQEGDNVNITISQIPSHPSVSFFELPLPLLLKGIQNDTLIRIDHRYSGQQFSLQIPWKVDSVILDPELWIIQWNPMITSYREPVADEQIKISPNPVTGFLDIELSPSLFNAHLSLFDVQGTILYSIAEISTCKLRIPVDHFPQGLYFLQIQYDDKRKVFKFLK